MGQTAKILPLGKPEKKYKQPLKNEQAIFKDLHGLNRKKNIKLRYRRLDDNLYSLFLDFWPKEGKPGNKIRQYYFLGLKISGTQKYKIEDEQILRTALEIRDRRQRTYNKFREDGNEENFKLKDEPLPGNSENFIDYFKSISDKKNDHNYDSVLVHLKDFTGEEIKFKLVTTVFCENFKQYLLTKAGLSPSTAYSYFLKFKTILNEAVKRKIIPENPARYIPVKSVKTSRTFLVLDELKKLKKTPLKEFNVKNAFLFSCFTGLRLSDIKALKYSDIQDGYIYIRQIKTDEPLRIKLNDNAIKITNEQQRSNQNKKEIFDLPIYRAQLNKILRKWAEKAKIEKRIHYHVSRHTFATLALTFDIDIYTVSKLLGHQDLATTQIYAQLIDRKKDEAIDKLPEI